MTKHKYGKDIYEIGSNLRLISLKKKYEKVKKNYRFFDKNDFSVLIEKN